MTGAAKRRFDEKTGRLRMKRVLSLSVVYPTEYGFVLDTLARRAFNGKKKKKGG